MTIRLLLCFFCVLPARLFSQNLYLEWAGGLGGNLEDNGFELISDDSGNVYLTGTFEDSADFDPHNGKFVLVSNGASDIFIAKYNYGGRLLWAKSFGGNGMEHASSLTLDTTGDIYVTGNFSDTVNFDPSTSSFIFATSGFRDLFVLKLSNGGNVKWAKAFGGNLAVTGTSIITKGTDKVYIAGVFTDSIFHNPSSPHTGIKSNGFDDSFIIKLDGGGTFSWIKSWGGGGIDQVADICTDRQGNIFTTGIFDSITDLDPSVAFHSVRSKGFSDIFLQKLDQNGNLIWAETFGGNLGDQTTEINCDSKTSLLLTGFFKGNCDFDPDTSVQYLLSSNGLNDIFILNLDSLGDFNWAKKIGGVKDDAGHSLCVSQTGFIALSGGFNGTVDFDPGPATFNISVQDQSAYVLNLDSAGDLTWVRSFSGNGRCSAVSVDYDNSGNIYLTGGFKGTIEFDPDSLSTYFMTSSTSDAFVLKLSACGYVYGEDIIESCGPYTWKDGKTYYEDNDTASVTFTNRHGCDSLTCLKLTVHDVNVSVQNNDPQIKALAAADSYQWLDCNNGYAALPGDTNQTFTATANGKYAVEVEQHGCKDTSDCIEIKSLSLHQPGMTEVKVFPNPFSGEITISGKQLGGSEIIIHSTIGDLVHREILTATDKHSLRLSVPAGIYILSLNSDSGNRKVMLVRK